MNAGSDNLRPGYTLRGGAHLNGAHLKVWMFSAHWVGSRGTTRKSPFVLVVCSGVTRQLVLLL